MALTTAVEDMGFCSSEEYELHSPTDSSEDSVEVKISPILLKNKRKLIEPRKVNDNNDKQFINGPLKKRMCLKVKQEEQHPFRPWSPSTVPNSFIVPVVPITTRPNSSYFRPPTPPPTTSEQQQEPVSLVKNKREELRVPIHPQIATLSTVETERIILNTTESFPVLQDNKIKEKKQQSLSNNNNNNASCSNSIRREQRNYKNMTRERRIEANARERTRVHTISAAFDTLRRSIPSYSNVQKLSKLSVLRIACSYIMTLSSIVNESDSNSTSECVDLVTRTIQREGKLRKKKDDSD